MAKTVLTYRDSQKGKYTRLFRDCYSRSLCAELLIIFYIVSSNIVYCGVAYCIIIINDDL